MTVSLRLIVAGICIGVVLGVPASTLYAGDGTPTNILPVTAFSCAPYNLTTTLQNSEAFPVDVTGTTFVIYMAIGSNWSLEGSIPGNIGTLPASGTFDVTSNSPFTFPRSGTYRIVASFTASNDINPANNSSEIIVKVLPANQCLLANSNYPYAGLNADPVNGHTGGFFYNTGTLLNLFGPMPLTFAMFYDVYFVNDHIPTSTLGMNWAHNYDFTMRSFLGDMIEIITANGMYIAFEKIGGVWQRMLPKDTPYQLVQQGSSTFMLDPLAGTQYEFNTSGKLVKVYDGRGNTHTLTYDANDRLQEVADGLGRKLRYSYDANGKLQQVFAGTKTVLFQYSNGVLSGITDANANTTTFSYAASGNAILEKITNPLGNAPYTMTTNGNRVVSQTNALGGTTSLTYPPSLGGATMINHPGGANYTQEHTPDGRLTRLTDEDGNSIEYAYDVLGRRTSITDRTGKMTKFTYDDASGRISSIETPEGDKTTAAFINVTQGPFAVWRVSEVTDPKGGLTKYEYDAGGRMTKVTTPTSEVYSWTHNAGGQPLTFTHDNGGTYTFSYFPFGTLQSVTDPDNNTTAYVCDPLFRINKITSPTGSVWTRTHDGLDNVLSATDPNGKTRQYAYDQNGRRSSVTDEKGSVTTFMYDAMDRLVRVTDPENRSFDVQRDNRLQTNRFTDARGNAVQLAYDSRGNVASMTFPGGREYKFTYDDEFRLTKKDYPNGQSFTYSYDDDGTPLGIATPLGRTLGWQYDANGNLTRSTDQQSRPTDYTYDSQNRLTQAALPGGRTVTYGYDAGPFVKQFTDALGSNWQISWDDRGNPISSTDPLGNTTTYSYDASGRLTGKTFPGSMGSVAYTYDANNRVTSANYSDGTTRTYAYDELGRVTATNNATFVHGPVFPFTESNGVKNTYDGAGSITAVEYGVGKIVTYEYDASNNCTAIEDWNSKRTQFTYDNLNRLTRITYPNTVVSTYTYDNDNRVTGITHGSHASIMIEYNADGTIRSVNKTVPLQPKADAIDASFTYDAASRIATVHSGPPPGGGGAPNPQIPATFDARGNLLDDGRVNCTWNLGQELIDATVGSTKYEFDYDGFRNVTGFTNGFGFTFARNYAFPGAPPAIITVNGSAQTFNVFLPNGNPLYFINPNNTNIYLHFDENGNNILQTDQSGGIFSSSAFSPTGLLTDHQGPQDPFYWSMQAVRANIIFRNTDLADVNGLWQDVTTGRSIESAGFSAPWQLQGIGGPYTDNSNLSPGGNTPVNIGGSAPPEELSLGGTWAPVRDIRFRGNYSRAVRAPSVSELFGGSDDNAAPGGDEERDPWMILEQTPGVLTERINVGGIGGRYSGATDETTYTGSMLFTSSVLFTSIYGDPVFKDDEDFSGVNSDALSGGISLSPGVTTAPPLPGRDPGLFGGTSMAAPHLAGLPGLLNGSQTGNGLFWFFNNDNWEAMVKVLNGVQLNNRYWVFAGGLTNVEYRITVTDTQTSSTRTYFNPLGKPFAPVLDTQAFATCP